MVVPNSPKHNIKTRTNDANREGMSKGRVIFRYFLSEPIPATVAASSSERGICLIPFPVMRADINNMASLTDTFDMNKDERYYISVTAIKNNVSSPNSVRFSCTAHD